MSEMPWFKCYPDAWLNKTRRLNLEVRAAYWDCVCLIYKTETPISQDDKWMSHYLHTSTRKWRAIRDELIAKGFLLNTPDGLVDERASQEVEKRTLQRRTNAEIASNRERNKRENLETHNEINKTEARKQHHIERTEKEREEKKKEHCAVSPSRATARRDVSTEDLDLKFEEFWSVFPSGRKKGKGKSKALFRQIARGGHYALKASPEVLIAAAKAYAATKPDPQFTPMPQTWLAGGRWEDDPSEQAPVRNGYAAHSRPSGSITDYSMGFSPAELEAMRNARPAN